MTRRGLAKAVGFTDEFGAIPDASWMRAMTFERLGRDERFASEVATTAVGRLDLDRPTKVVIVNARINDDRTAQLLADALEGLARLASAAGDEPTARAWFGEAAGIRERFHRPAPPHERRDVACLARTP